MRPSIDERARPAPCFSIIGRRAIVIGAGTAGLAAAAVLADWFENVLVLDRDVLSDSPMRRSGTPQDGHAHGLLVGGLRALEERLPGLSEDFVRAGAVAVGISRDLREEWPNHAVMPQRDFGLHAYTMTRPVLELTLRQRVLRRTNVAIRDDTRVLGIVAHPNGKRVTGVECATDEGQGAEIVEADLVVDASGRGHLSSGLLQSIGLPRPPETAIGIDLGYTTAILDIPDNAPTNWKLVLAQPDVPRSTRRAVMVPIEGHRWMLTIFGLGAERPPREWEALQAYARGLSGPTIYNAIRNAKPVQRLARFGLAASVWRHFEDLRAFPDGLLPIGDAICRFNPAYGQGMSVAAKEANLLHRMLADRAADADTLAGLGPEFLTRAASIIETPWAMAAVPDLAFPQTRGERPADLEASLQFGAALSRMAARDESVHKLMVEVWHLLKPISVYEEPALKRRTQAEMAEVMAA